MWEEAQMGLKTVWLIPSRGHMHDHMIEGPFVATMHMLFYMLTKDFLETMYVYSVGLYFIFIHSIWKLKEDVIKQHFLAVRTMELQTHIVYTDCLSHLLVGLLSLNFYYCLYFIEKSMPFITPLSPISGLTIAFFYKVTAALEIYFNL